ncbi:MAG: bifunctional 5,10-methylenetetrahydrofolate dehydrogenase/5,10-methenyltetrahydrofolate cyclohydrolase [Lachnospiraceae bacterium]|nr:bifunctional 5,10-methylenetetrahydrofolate dehydrogenase/5,10-methenyltetrahydrofolate cyclohydrolase [Lachnospiraceae bacterium]
MQELRGMPVAKSLREALSQEILRLKESGTVPRLAIVRVGEREDDLSYERGVYRQFEAAGAQAETTALPETVSQRELEDTVRRLDENEDVDGILLFRPLPGHLDEAAVCSLISKRKDIDCMTPMGAAHIFVGDKEGHPPCTPQAVMELLSYYGVDLTGRRVTVVGRSMVVGRPLAMLLLQKNATVTICHSKTENLAEECRRADILIVCAGVPEMITKEYMREGQIIVDVGIHAKGDGLCGDVKYEHAREIAGKVTPVPGGVGSVTTVVLLRNTVESAKKRNSRSCGKG